jgi:hypothetical protein
MTQREPSFNKVSFLELELELDQDLVTHISFSGTHSYEDFHYKRDNVNFSLPIFNYN